MDSCTAEWTHLISQHMSVISRSLSSQHNYLDCQRCTPCSTSVFSLLSPYSTLHSHLISQHSLLHVSTSRSVLSPIIFPVNTVIFTAQLSFVPAQLTVSLSRLHSLLSPYSTLHSLSTIILTASAVRPAAHLSFTLFSAHSSRLPAQ